MWGTLEKNDDVDGFAVTTLPVACRCWCFETELAELTETLKKQSRNFDYTYYKNSPTGLGNPL